MDQCKHCTARGDLAACQSTECHKHGDWIVVALHDRVAEQAAEIARLRARQRELSDELAALRPRSPWAEPDLDLLP